MAAPKAPGRQCRPAAPVTAAAGFSFSLSIHELPALARQALQANLTLKGQRRVQNSTRTPSVRLRPARGAASLMNEVWA